MTELSSEAGQVKKGLLDKIFGIFGVSESSTTALDQTYGQGIREGLIIFTPHSGENGIYGTMGTSYVNDQGQQEPITIELTNSDVAAYMAGVQSETNAKNKK